jgi:hypothetical protein
MAPGGHAWSAAPGLGSVAAQRRGAGRTLTHRTAPNRLTHGEHPGPPSRPQSRQADDTPPETRIMTGYSPRPSAYTMEVGFFDGGHGEHPGALTNGERRRHTLSPQTAAMLAAARKRSGLSVRQAAARVRVAAGMISMMEAGTGAPSRVDAERLVDVYQVTEAEAKLLLSEAVSGVGYDYRQARSDE